MQSLTEARNAFYVGKRTESLPLAVTDVVTVKRGKRNGAVAIAISLESMPPDPKYLVEYEDGADEVISLADLQWNEKGR